MKVKKPKEKSTKIDIDPVPVQDDSDDFSDDEEIEEEEVFEEEIIEEEESFSVHSGQE